MLCACVLSEANNGEREKLTRTQIRNDKKLRREKQKENK
jgi:hypothetical protein